MASIFKKTTTQREHRPKEKQEVTYTSTCTTLNNAAHTH